jgi:amino acid adenylation domain-containing protein
MNGGTVPQAWVIGEPCHVADIPVHELFRRQVRSSPGALAVQQWDERLTYQELADSAEELARRLVTAGVAPSARVGICMRRTLRLPASQLAVLMAHGTFVPLDPDQPAQRLIKMINDAGIETALVDSPGEDLLSGAIPRLIRADRPAGHDRAGMNPGTHSVGQGDVAYIMYTSGSTGEPKGVMVSHRNLAAFVTAINQHLGDAPGYSLAAFAAIGFDVSIFEIFAPLTYGSSMQLVPDAERADPELLQRFLQVHRTSHLFLPPVLLPFLDPDGLPDLRALIAGGEASDPRQVGRWATGQRRFYNWYGPTEATVAVVGTELSGQWETPLPLGRPLPGCRMYILDEGMRPCTPGIAGELYAGGPQVSLGYVASTPEAAGRFVPDPWASGIMYRTGDLAQWDDSGQILFLGRADRQLKIHGRRIEPGEIEAILSQHPQVAQAVVDITGSTIRAYVTPAEAPGDHELREYCASWLPAHMVPTSVSPLTRLPMTINAKVDFAALRQLRPPGPAAPDHQPGLTEPLEHIVAECWAAMFDGWPGSDDDFFLAGGDSLSAMRLAAALRQATGRDLAVADIFDGRTVCGIAARLSAIPPAGDALPTGSQPALSPAQRQLWFIEQLAPGIPLHNIVLAEHIAGPLRTGTLERALGLVISRQSALRWQLRPGDRAAGGRVPAVMMTDPVPVTIPVDDLTGLPAERRQAATARLLDAEAHTPVGLEAGPLWRARLLRLHDDEHVLILTVHHIIFDGWSQDVLYRELGQAYRGLLADSAPPDALLPQHTFADYTAWVTGRSEQATSVDLAWWAKRLTGAPAVVELPGDRPRPPRPGFRGASCGADVDEAILSGITDLAAVAGTAASAVLLAAFGVLLRRLTGQDDLVIGTPIADRGHVEVEQLVGFFVRVVPLRLRVDDHADFADMVRACGDELMSARQHSDVPLERIVTLLGARDPGRNPLFQVMFNVYNFAEAHLDLGPLVTRPLQAGVPGSHVDLTLYVIFQGGGMRVEAAYNCDLYDAARIEALLASYLRLLRELTADPGRVISAAGARPDCSPLPDWEAALTAGIPAGPGLVEQVRSIARCRPGTVAVAAQGGDVSYRDLIQITARVAAAVRSAGAGTAAVLAARTAVLPGILLGILSAGARWVLLDSDLPQPVLERWLFTLAPSLVIQCGTRGLGGALATCPVISAADLAGEAITVTGTGPASDAPVGERGYLSMTSGTTGDPKVVRAAEVPLVHFVNWYRATFGLGEEDRFALLGSLSHDPLLRDIFTPLTCGATLAVPPAGLMLDPSGLLAWLAAERITVAHVTPQLLRMMTGSPRGHRVLPLLHLVAVAGDQLTRADASALRSLAPRARLLNCYGTTETPQVQAYHEIQAGQSADPERPAMLATAPVPVGRGIDGTQLLVVTASGSPAAVGELGEVVIRSHYLSDGYVGAGLDSGQFDAVPGVRDGRVFRTGDLGRYDPAGEVTLAGRTDDQVKIRGFRVGLGEVEAALRAHPGVTGAAAQVIGSRNGPALHGYVTTTGPAVTEQGVLRHVRALLPPYAVPAGITFLAELPLTGGGKVNRGQLPPPRCADGRAEPGPPPAPGLEGLVTAIWCEVLGRTQVGLNQNFFEIGGDSMAIIEVQWRLTSSLGRTVPVVDLFRFPTVRGLAGYLASGTTDTSLMDADLRGRKRRHQRAAHPRPPVRRGDGDSGR